MHTSKKHGWKFSLVFLFGLLFLGIGGVVPKAQGCSCGPTFPFSGGPDCGYLSGTYYCDGCNCVPPPPFTIPPPTPCYWTYDPGQCSWYGFIDCGFYDDGCGDITYCGTCPTGKTCDGRKCVCSPTCDAFGACSATCGGGTQSQSCTRADCSTYVNSQTCNTQACPPACVPGPCTGVCSDPCLGECGMQSRACVGGCPGDTCSQIDCGTCSTNSGNWQEVSF